MGMSHVIRLLSAGEAETRKLPWGLQESDIMGAWPGDVSTRTQLVRNLQRRERERGVGGGGRKGERGERTQVTNQLLAHYQPYKNPI